MNNLKKMPPEGSRGEPILEPALGVQYHRHLSLSAYNVTGLRVEWVCSRQRLHIFYDFER